MSVLYESKRDVFICPADGMMRRLRRISSRVCQKGLPTVIESYTTRNSP